MWSSSLYRISEEDRWKGGVTMCAPSGSAIKGSRCHDSGIGNGEDFLGAEEDGIEEEDVSPGAGVTEDAGRGG